MRDHVDVDGLVAPATPRRQSPAPAVDPNAPLTSVGAAALQRLAGNHAVTYAIQRQGGKGADDDRPTEASTDGEAGVAEEEAEGGLFKG